MCKSKILLCVLAAVAVAWAATPAAASVAAISDVLRVTSPAGSVFEVVLAEGDENGDLYFFSNTNIPDVLQIGHGIALIEPNGKISDIFGVAPTNDSPTNGGGVAVLGFLSDTEALGEVDPQQQAFHFPFIDARFEEVGGQAYDATSFLNAASRDAGWTALFISDADVPEPATIIVWSLLGSLAIGLGWWRRRKAA
jgi:hypothetical protein